MLLKSQEKNYFKSCPFHQNCDFGRIHNNKLSDKIELCDHSRRMKFIFKPFILQDSDQDLTA